MTTVVCVKCGWEWVTKSQAWVVSCPGCGSKIKIKERFEKSVSVLDDGLLEDGGLVKNDKSEV